MASFGGVAIFGRSVSIVTGDQELDRQENTFTGVNGVETLTLGTRGLMSEARGVLYGTVSADLATAESTFRSYRDGVSRVLIDTFGNSWNNVLLESFNPQGQVRFDATYGYIRPYVARFRHLTTS